jgi:hypothetical protein
MAINPNTNFTAGQILTADQQNRFPRGIVAYGENTTASGVIIAEAIQISAVTFTAVANRYYQIQYYENDVYNGGSTTITPRIRLNNVTGTIQASARRIEQTANTNQLSFITRIMTFSAGSVTLVATMQATSGGIIIDRTATSAGYLSVTDLGPA